MADIQEVAVSDYKQLLTDLSWEMGPCDREASEAIETRRRKVEASEEIIRRLSDTVLMIQKMEE